MSAAEMREALKPCPFCGGEATYRADHTTERVDSISCRRCDFYMSDPELEQGSVIATWNRRAPLPDEEGMAKDAEIMLEALERIEQWGRAYPLSVFPEPDFDKAREALEAAGMTLDAISASNMRHVVKGVSEIARAALRAINGGKP